MGWWNIDILYQMFKNGVVYHRAPDHGIPGGRYPPGTNKGLTQDQSHIQYKEKAKAKYGTPARIRKAKPTKPAKSSTRIRKARSTKPAMTQKEKVRQQVNRYVERQIQILRNSQVVDDLERVNFRETLNALQTENVPNEVIQYYIQSIQPLLKAKEEELQKKEKELDGKILREIKRLQKGDDLNAIRRKIDDAKLSEYRKEDLQKDVDKKYRELNADDESEDNDRAVALDDKNKELNLLYGQLDNVQSIIEGGNTGDDTYTDAIKRRTEIQRQIKNITGLSANMDNLHPFVMKPAAPQLHMQKLHMQTSMEKLDLEPAMETVPDDVHVQAVQPMKCGDKMACAKHETEHAHGDMKCKHEAAEGKITEYAKKKAKEMAEKAKKMEKKSGKSTLGQIGEAIFGRQHCDSCGELHDGDHDCEVEAFEAMLDGYDSEGLTLEKPRCASVGLANRKLNELH